MINNVVLVGRLTKDPDLRYTHSGSAVATFTLAVNRNFTNQSGNREADFINCVIWRKPAENLATYARKGTLIGVTGRIQTRNYENQQGQRVYVTEVICENFQLLESRSMVDERNKNNADYNTAQSNHEPNNNTNQQQQGNNSMPNFNSNNKHFDGKGSTIDISDDDLPF
ncbi:MULTISPECIES: single-stranded DNA-binding protein [unclassified Enterococcus]|uniref:single-stranded DNA-binding protein n=1 Tax=unclassified Enterococcus TaxID=2608891 RepID=UPI001CE0BB89|nr:MULTISPECIES: single-stranded DNA-binding protein [unclassified Enterococcus]MCA5014573.1 single-stranded DNA-binding protein [Enterococcus sp. S23]MCA5017826.1 single-stranded DNA-binding protein [Enterococcus sp. S22(2020)]